MIAHSSDLDDRRIGMRAPEWITAAIEGKERTLIVGPGWSGPDNVYAVERLARAPGWVVGAYTRRATQQASGWAALRWLLAGGAALAVGLAVVVWASRRETLRHARRETEVLQIAGPKWRDCTQDCRLSSSCANSARTGAAASFTAAATSSW